MHVVRRCPSTRFFGSAGIASFSRRADGASSGSQRFPEGRGSVAVPLWESMGVDLQCHRSVPVAKPPSDGTHIMAGSDELSGSEVTQRMQMSVHPDFRGDRPHVVTHGVGSDRAHKVVGEYGGVRRDGDSQVSGPVLGNPEVTL